MQDTNDEVKENGLLRRVNGRFKKSKNDKGCEEHNENNVDVKEEENVQNDTQSLNEQSIENDKEEKAGNFSERDEVKKTRTRATVNNRISGNLLTLFCIP